MKYFVFNKESDYIRGWMKGCVWDGQGIRLSGTQDGFFISRLLDSREQGTVWHRIVMESQCEGDAAVQVSFYASDTEKMMWRGGSINISAFAADDTISWEEKERVWKPFLKQKALNPTDILLHDTVGRYLWFAIHLIGPEPAIIRDIRVFFPKETWLSYLPEAYAGQESGTRFLERYLGIFQSMYQDMEETIRRCGAYLDLDGGPEPVIRWMAGWLDVPDEYLWPADKLRRLLKQAFSLYAKRGTKEGLIEMITLYTGEKPLVVETFETRAYRHRENKGACLGRLYGEDENSITLLVKEEYLASSRDYETLLRLAQQMTPAHIQIRLAPLKAFIFLGSYSYLGINSRLGHYRPMALDGRSLLPFAVVGKDGERTTQEGQKQEAEE